MRRKKLGNKEWLEFEVFDPFPEVVHGTFLRGSEEDSLGLYHIAAADQEHKIKCHHVQDKNEEIVADILVTQERGIGLSMQHADCQAALFYDPKTQSIAAVHAGWRGQVQDIYQETVRQMQERFGTKAEDLFVAISLSLGPKNSEFIHYRTELPTSFWEFKIGENYFDLWQIAVWQLQCAGVRKEQIQLAALCTYEDPTSFFSYRRDRKKGFGAQHKTIIGLCHA